MSGAPSLYFLNHYLPSIRTPFQLAIASSPVRIIQYANNKKLILGLRYTNAGFWDVYTFKFSEGGPFTKQQLDNAEKVAVISEETRDNYFGKDIPATGKYIESGNDRFRVTGVVKTVPVTQTLVSADIYVPYTISAADLRNTDVYGNYNGTLLAGSPSDLPAIQNEYNYLLTKIPIHSKEYDQLSSYADKYFESVVRASPLGDHSSSSGLGRFYLILTILSLLFLLLPAINLVNINISRILERSSEIGMRKSFGASSAALALQFLIENLILTGIGCLIGLILSSLIIYIINQQNIINNVRLTINLHVLMYSLLSFLVFGLLSGVYPAWRMSRMHIVTALKAQ